MRSDPSFLQGLWFVLIGVLWVGFFVLEGFDFGVGMLIRFLGRGQAEKRALIHTIGPVWDGNEVWLIVAGGAMFAAFPGWYATVFSGFYLALFLVLAALIVRGVCFEFWGKVDSARWRAGWEWAMAVSSGAAALLFGVAWADFVHGVPINAHRQVTASLGDLLHPYALLGGVTMLSLCLAHGAGFLALRTTGGLRGRARATAGRVAPLAALLIVAFLAWTAVGLSFAPGRVALAVIAAGAAIAAPIAVRRSDAWGFGATAGAVVLLMVVMLAALYPNALPSSTDHAFDLTLSAASSSRYTLVVMTVVAVIFVPVVLAYQAWTYWVFRHRLGREDYEGPLTPVAVLEHRDRRRRDQPPSASSGPPAGS